jgi:hypothetical protein
MLVIMALALAVTGVRLGWHKNGKAELIPVVVVEKITHPANVSYLVGYTEPVAKVEVPKRIFKKNLGEVSYIIVGSDANGVEYNIGVNRIAFTQINLLDTLWTTR